MYSLPLCHLGSACNALYMATTLNISTKYLQKHFFLLKLCFNNMSTWGLPGDSMVKNQPSNAGDVRSILGLGKSPGERNGHPLHCSLPGKFHGVGERSLAGYSPWGRKE